MEAVNLWVNIAGIGLEVIGFVLIFKAQGRADFSGGFSPGKAMDQIRVVTHKRRNTIGIGAIVAGLIGQGVSTFMQIYGVGS